MEQIPRGSATASVDEDRLWQRHVDMARIGATPNGGVNRQALTQEEGEAKALLVRWAEDLGLRCETDDIGNLFIRRAGVEDGLAPVLSGSHIDTQPKGGRFDGISGVLAAFEALQAMVEAGVETRRPIEAVAWTNEEGSRFVPGCMGSRTFIAPDRLGEFLPVQDLDGVSVETALAEVQSHIAHISRRPLGGEIAAFVELHIEQGPVLEAKGIPIGVVTGIQGLRRFSVEVMGEDGHAGTVPRLHKKDAVSAAVAMISALEDMFFADDPEDRLRFTVGQVVVEPNSPSTIPGRVRFSVDFRHPDSDTIQSLGDRVEPLCRENAGPCRVSVTEIFLASPVVFPDRIRRVIADAADGLSLANMSMLSGAMHDAWHISQICPTGMIFVPCEKGISHNEKENAMPSDLAAGTRVLTEALVALANQ